ncbi:methyl-accepting chemotaxis protein [Paenibacillus sp. SI8]|uniref:methyl-accepting chemotaxis protein n=1 Tax=unclassified Paenibacillus TaxID=185978 RepID=UPI003467DB29
MLKIFQRSIQTKILATSLFLLLIPILILGSTSYYVSSKVTDSLIEKDLRNTVQMSIQLIESFDASVKTGSISKEEAQEKVKVLMLGPKKEGKRPINPKIDLGPSGYFFVLDKKGNELAHPSLEGQNIWDRKSNDGTLFIQDMIQKAETGGGFTTYMWSLPGSKKEGMKITYAEMDPSWGWIVAAGSYMQDYNSGQTHILNTIIVTFAVCLVVGVILLVLFARHISKPLIQVERQASEIAVGDLKISNLNVKNRDEIGRLAASFNQMKAYLRQLVSQAGSSSSALNKESVQLSHAVDHMLQAANHISTAMQSVAENTNEHAQSVVESAAAMKQLSDSIQHVASSSSTAFGLSANTVAEAEKGNAYIHQTTEQMQAVSSTMVHLSGLIELLRQRSAQIGDIVSIIADISSQTNLLALNASIEAARAGEHGNGFAVVAGEVKKLAARSKQSSEQVADLILGIQGDIQGAVKTMQQGDREISSSVGTLQETGLAFEKIHKAVKMVLEQVQQTSSEAGRMAGTSQQVMLSLHEMEHSANQSAGAAQTISSLTESQLSSIDGMVDSVRHLNEMSAQLQDVIQKFKA